MMRYPPPGDFTELIATFIELKALLNKSAPLDIPPSPAEVVAMLDELVKELLEGRYPHSAGFEIFTSPKSVVYEICQASGWERDFLQIAEKLERNRLLLKEYECERVYDLCFTTGLRLQEIAQRLGLGSVEFDGENKWEWVIGSIGRYRVDITRDHRVPPHTTPTRLFLVPYVSFPKELCEQLVSALHSFSDGKISIGTYHDEEFHTLQDFYSKPAIDEAEACSIALAFANKQWHTARDFRVKDVKFLTRAMIREDIGLKDDVRRESVIARMPEQWWVWMDCYFGARRDSVCVQVNPDTKQPDCIRERL